MQQLKVVECVTVMDTGMKRLDSVTRTLVNVSVYTIHMDTTVTNVCLVSV